MKKSFYPIISCALLTMCMLFSLSCSDGPESDWSQFVGSWYGTRYYNNPVGGIKYQYLTIELNADGTGSLDYEAPTSISKAYYVWSVSGNYIECNGGYASSNGDIDASFYLRLRIEKDRLIPENHYNVFILTRDGSVMTDGDGNEAPNPEQQADKIFNTWVESSGLVVLNLESSGRYQEYTLSSPYAKTYADMVEGYCSFEPLKNRLSIDYTGWDVLELTDYNLLIKNGNKTISYNRGSVSDIPTSVDLGKYITSTRLGWADDDDKYCFWFSDNGTVTYMENSGQSYGSFGRVYLSAKGVYTLSGQKLTCYYNDVYWDYGTSGAADFFPGWICGQPCTQVYNIEECYSGLRLTFPNGKIVYLEKIGG